MEEPKRNWSRCRTRWSTGAGSPAREIVTQALDDQPMAGRYEELAGAEVIDRPTGAASE